MASTFSYDRVPYPGHAYAQTHPNRLATVAYLNGMTPKRLSECRVLELGCGDGANLVPMAFHHPDSEFVGIDLSASAIEEANTTATALGMRNVRFEQADIAALGPDFGTFDYIAAHGVYSWVPPPVREAILALFAERLSPKGVAYVSYNCLPGSHLRNVARDIMLYHVRDEEDPVQRIAQGRAILRFIAENRQEKDVYWAVLRDQLARVEKLRDQVLFHDDLDRVSTPFLVSQVAEVAGRHGLRYLGDATLRPPIFVQLDPPLRRALEGMRGGDRVVREQYFDFFAFIGFRQTLLCRAEVPLNDEVDPRRLRDLHLAAWVRPKDPNLDPRASGTAEFAAGREGTVAVDHPLGKAALLVLARRWPCPIGFDALVAEAARLAGSSAAPADEVDGLADLLFRAWAAEAVQLSWSPPRLAGRVSERPEISGYVRACVGRTSILTTPLHETVQVEDAIARRFIPLADGSRTVDQLVEALKAELEGGREAKAPAEEVTREAVERNLEMLRGLGLLVA
jgi:trans-aconitate methyltransferase